MMVLREVALPITTCILRMKRSRGLAVPPPAAASRSAAVPQVVFRAGAQRKNYIMPSKNSIGLLSSVRVMMAFFQLLV